MKQLVLVFLALSIAAFSPAGTHSCRELHDQVIQPSRNIASFLGTQPSLETLSGQGCLYLLSEFRQLPMGAQRIREMGARGVENTQSRCTTAVNSIRYPCAESTPGETRCLPEAYSYCGQWAYSMTSQPKYELAMELSTEIEVAYDKAQQLCGAAMNWDEATTTGAARDLLTYLQSQVEPMSEKLYLMSCGE